MIKLPTIVVFVSRVSLGRIVSKIRMIVLLTLVRMELNVQTMLTLLFVRVRLDSAESCVKLMMKTVLVVHV